MANAYLAIENDLEIIPVLNKIDLPAADVAEAELEVHELTGATHDELLSVSAKTGEGVEDVLEAVVARTPPPRRATPTAPLAGADLRLAVRPVPRRGRLRARRRRLASRARAGRR